MILRRKYHFYQFNTNPKVLLYMLGAKLGSLLHVDFPMMMSYDWLTYFVDSRFCLVVSRISSAFSTSDAVKTSQTKGSLNYYYFCFV